MLAYEVWRPAVITPNISGVFLFTTNGWTALIAKGARQCVGRRPSWHVPADFESWCALDAVDLGISAPPDPSCTGLRLIDLRRCPTAAPVNSGKLSLRWSAAPSVSWMAASAGTAAVVGAAVTVVVDEGRDVVVVVANVVVVAVVVDEHAARPRRRSAQRFMGATSLIALYDAMALLTLVARTRSRDQPHARRAPHRAGPVQLRASKGRKKCAVPSGPHPTVASVVIARV